MANLFTSKMIRVVLVQFACLLLVLGYAQERPKMYYADQSVPSRPYAKDPYVIYFKGTYWMYYSVPDSLKKQWHIGIAVSNDLTVWKKVGDIMPQQNSVEAKGICAPSALIKEGVLHLFYQTYGNGKGDAICHAFSNDGIHFQRDLTNPIFRPALSDWTCGRAIDAEVIAFKNQYFLYYATRDTAYQIQQQGVAVADLHTDFSRNAWREISGMPMMKPELPWEKSCIEAASCIQKDGVLYMFYAGGYNNEPQQIGVAKSEDGIHWKRLSDQPFLTHGTPGSWNASESGHPNILKAENGKYYLFFQGNNDKGKTWYLSKVEITWDNTMPVLIKN